MFGLGRRPHGAESLRVGAEVLLPARWHHQTYTPIQMGKILVVEDDPMISRALNIRLGAAGHETSWACDTDSAVELAQSTSLDLAIIDISIPGGGGFVVAAKLRENSETHEIPIVFMTASKDPEFRLRANAAGAVGFVEKPYDAQLLLAMIDSALSAGHPAEAQIRRAL